MKKEMLINVLQPEECRIAIVEDGILEELYVERTSLESYTGNIYKGKVVNIEPAIQAAFVDFSVGRNGFLHVSDVEPQYYRSQLVDDSELTARDRGRDPRFDRDETPPATPSSSAANDEDRPRDRDRRRDRPRSRDRDRPDLSEKGRRDRSERPFGQGLIGDIEPEPLPASRPEPIERDRDRDRDRDRVRGREEPRPERRYPDPIRPSEPPPPRPSARVRDVVRPEPEDEPIGWDRQDRLPEPHEYEPDLPPSRTRRQPIESRPVRGFDTERDAPAPEPETEAPTARIRDKDKELDRPSSGGGRRRSRGRGGRPSRPGTDPEGFEEPEYDLPSEPEPEPDFDALEEESSAPSRRRGRDAIRSRGGDRERGGRRQEPAPTPARSEAPTTRQPVSREPLDQDSDENQDLPVDRTRRGSPPESDPARRRIPPHNRAGEPGYVPRRVRTRSIEIDDEPEALAPTRPEPGPRDRDRDRNRNRDRDRPEDLDADLDLEPDAEAGAEDSEERSGEPRRRRRRRRRGRDREDRPGDAPAEAGDRFADDLDDEDEDDRDEGLAAQAPRRREVLDLSSREIEETALADDFDFVDQEDEEGDEEVIAAAVAEAEADDEIDPGLQEEIEREIEEIRELERSMGLRGPVEARPRRGGESDDDDEPDDARPGPGRGRGPRGASKPPIQEVFKRGSEVLVQVIKESIGTKGPTLSTYISIPGRYLVLMPGLNRVGVSRKIADEGQRRKLRQIMQELNPPKGLGFIVRTAGLDRTKRELARDLAYLLRLWKVILRRIKKAKAPAPIYQESDMIIRTIRDIFTAEIDTIWIDEPAAFERAQEFLRVVMPRFVDRLKLYDGKVPLFHKYGLEEEINKIQRRQVPLRDGGSIVIDQTEALVAIDVNSGNFRFEDDAERTAYEMNLRAAKEIARQLRLRDLGGVIVNDFIDMREEKHRRGVERALRDAVKRDRARTKVLRMSQFGIIEMTRQRIRPSLKRSVYAECEHCSGAGLVKTVESMAIDVMRVLAFTSHREDVRHLEVGVCEEVATFLNNRKRGEIARLEETASMTINITPEAGAVREFLQVHCVDAHGNETPLAPTAPTNPPPRRSNSGRRR
ncbi:hypothetical protein BH23PLA1_BH23PLA1_27820 [soil metagenome]